MSAGGEGRNEDMVLHAMMMMRRHPQCLKEAQNGTALGNTSLGEAMESTFKRSRWATETAVREAAFRLGLAAGGRR